MQGVVWQNEFRIVKYLSVVDKHSFRLHPPFEAFPIFRLIFLGILNVQFHCICTKRNLPCCCFFAFIRIKNISAVLLFPSSILLRTITTGDVITQKHAVKTIHATKIVTSPSNEIVIVWNDWSFSVKVLVWAYFSRILKGSQGNWAFWVIPDPALLFSFFLWTNNAV